MRKRVRSGISRPRGYGPLAASQAVAVGRLLGNRFSVYVVEFAGESRSFTDGEEAMGYAVGGG